MATQQVIVFLLVLGCSLYAAWKLMPAVARRAIARLALQLPLRGKFKDQMNKAAATGTAGGCDCSGCDQVVDKQRKPEEQVVRFHARTKHAPRAGGPGIQS